MKHTLAIVACLAALPGLAAGDPVEGRKIVLEKQCETCHSAKTPSDARAVYLRKDRKVTSLEKLEAQVALCNSDLGLQMFPDEEENVVAFINSEYYHFPAK